MTTSVIFHIKHSTTAAFDRKAGSGVGFTNLEQISSYEKEKKIAIPAVGRLIPSVLTDSLVDVEWAS